MSSNSHPNDPSAPTISWKMLIAFWLIIAVVYLGRAYLLQDSLVLFNDTDDAMRMVGVRDLLAGQGWADNMQYRANAPYGHEMHWSRLIDAPLALLVRVLEPIAGENAYLMTAAIWPIILIFFLFYLSARLTVHLAGRTAQLAALVVPLISFALLPEFSPGRVDHHNVQILLSLAMLVCVIESQTGKYAAFGAGLACALSLGIGLESLIFVLLTVVTIGLFWVYYGAIWRGRMVQFGLGFAVPMVVIFLSFTPSANYFRPDCDALSLVFVTVALLIGGVFCFCAALSATLTTPLKRFVAIAIGGLIVIVCALAVFPQCLGGPYQALGDFLRQNWIDNIVEARSIFVTLKAAPAQAIALALAPIIGLGLTVRLAIKQRQIGWVLVALYLGTALIVTLFQVRGIRLAAIFCVPAAAQLIGAARACYLKTNRAIHAIGLVGSWLLFAGIAHFFLLNSGINLYKKATSIDTPTVTSASMDDKNICYLPARYQKLTLLPATSLMAPIDLGAHILLFTPHSIVSAPYHRNLDGVRDTFDFFNEPHTQALAIAQRRKLTLLVTCASFVRKNLVREPAQDALGTMLLRGELPDWLTPLSQKDEAIQIFKISLED